jgi:hypothetical protein
LRAINRIRLMGTLKEGHRITQRCLTFSHAQSVAHLPVADEDLKPGIARRFQMIAPPAVTLRSHQA